jgi:hypothetical protein
MEPGKCRRHRHQTSRRSERQDQQADSSISGGSLAASLANRSLPRGTEAPGRVAPTPRARSLHEKDNSGRSNQTPRGFGHPGEVLAPHLKVLRPAGAGARGRPVGRPER